MGFSKWESICGAAIVIALIVMMGSGGDVASARIKADTARIVSCNNLKAAAIAASQPVPQCAS